MNKARLHIRACKGMEHAVHHIVAHIGACRIGHGGFVSTVCDGLGHLHHRDGGKIGGRAFGCYKFAPGLVACVVRNAGVTDVHRDPLRGHRLAAGSHSHTDHCIRTNFFGLLQRHGCTLAKYHRDLQLIKGVFPHHIRQRLHRLPGRVHIRPTKGGKTGD